MVQQLHLHTLLSLLAIVFKHDELAIIIIIIIIITHLVTRHVSIAVKE